MSRSLLLLSALCVALVLPATLAAAVEKEFERVVPLNPSGAFSVSNVNGGINVETWNRSEARITARLKASDQQALDQIEIEISGQGDKVTVETKLPKNSDGDRSVSYNIWVPQGAQVSTNTVNGSVSVRDVAGAIRAKSVNGRVAVNAAGGEVDASTVNGKIEVSYRNAPNQGRHEFSTVNGSVSLSLPSAAGGDFDASSVNGSIDTDFPLTVERARFGGSSKLQGRFGSGNASFMFKPVNGSVKIQKSDRTI
jgi:DUF4097 and DUF4098 domain-containing protein YvlB